MALPPAFPTMSMSMSMSTSTALPSPFDPTAAPAFHFLDSEMDPGYVTSKEDMSSFADQQHGTAATTTSRGSGTSSAASIEQDAAWAGWSSVGPSSPSSSLSMSNLFSKVAMSIMKNSEPTDQQQAENPSAFQRECSDILSGCSRHLWW